MIDAVPDLRPTRHTVVGVVLEVRIVLETGIALETLIVLDVRIVPKARIALEIGVVLGVAQPALTLPSKRNMGRRMVRLNGKGTALLGANAYGSAMSKRANMATEGCLFVHPPSARMRAAFASHIMIDSFRAL